jgi:phytoene synthase
LNEWGYQGKGARRGSSAYYSIRFAPAALRDDLARLVGWRHEIRTIPDTVSDVGVACAKLEWWRGELERTLAGAPQHPLSQGLQPVLTRHGLPDGPFQAMLARVEAEIRRREPPDRDALEAAEEGDLGALFELLARCHGIADAIRLADARRLGGFCGQVERLRDVGRLVRAARPVFPRDQLSAADLPPGPLGAPSQRRRLPPLLAESAQAARRYRARIKVEHLPVCLRVRGRLAERLLDELAAADFDVTEAHLSLTPLNKLWHAWRESRRVAGHAVPSQ